MFAYGAVIGEKAQESGCLHGYDVRHVPVPFRVEHLRDGTKNYLHPGRNAVLVILVVAALWWTTRELHVSVEVFDINVIVVN